MPPTRVGAFELHPAERQLRRDGEPVDLGGRAFDLLCVLAEQPGRLVPKATLLERVWPRLVVDENNLPAQVASLRRVLGAGAIRTVPGFGYRLELPVGPLEATPAAAVLAGVPPPATPAAAPSPWPVPLAPLCGRNPELAEVGALLEASRVVALVGGPGLGKSRIAQEVLLRAARASDAAAWVDLQPLREAGAVPAAIALAIGSALPEAMDPWEGLARLVGVGGCLLVLDSVEGLDDGLRAPLARLLAECPGLRLLLTSQVAPGLPGERVYRLQPLAVPGADALPDELLACPAVQLFARHAGARDARFSLSGANVAQVAEVCRRLDGNALALELAAGRLASLGLANLLARLDDRLRLLRAPGHEPARHDALSTAFDWSYSLLAPAEQRVFNRLGAFPGSFDLQVAARTVADDTIDATEALDLIGRLVDRSLVAALPSEPPRYRLAETAQLYARARLAEAGELEDAREHMARSLLTRMDAAWQDYWSLDEALWLARHGPELDNLRAACDWAALGDPVACLGLYGSAWPLLVEADLHGEWRARFDQVVPLIREGAPPGRIGRFWEAVASLESGRRLDRARYAAELAASFHERVGDARGRYYALVLLACNARDDEPAARAALEVARALEDPAWPARLLALGDLAEAQLALAAGELATARAACARSVRHALATSERQALAASVCQVEIDLVGGDPAAALQLARPLAQGLRHAGRSETRIELLSVGLCALVESGQLAEARAMAAELNELALRVDRGRFHEMLDAMACLACASGRPADAARIVAVADDALAAHGVRRRRPAAQRMRERVGERLAAELGGEWLASARAARPRLDEAGACALALGLGS